MSQSNAAVHRIIQPVDTPEEMAAAPSTRAAHDFASSAAMQILREWSQSPEIRAIREANAAAPANQHDE